KSLDAGVSVNSEDVEPKEDEYSVLKTSCISSGYFDENERKRVLQDGEIQRLKEPVLDDSILMSRMNTPLLVGMNAYVFKAPKNTFLPDRLWQLKIDDNKTVTRWLAFYLGSDQGLNQIRDLASGTSNSMKNITKPDVLNLDLFVPSKEEQTKIASFLSTVDEKISQLTQKHALLSQYKQGMMQKLFSQQIRFKAGDGSDFGDWDEKFLSEIGSFKNGLNKDKESFGFGYPFVNLMDVFGKKIIETEYLGLVDATPKDLGNYDLRKGDVLFIRSSVKAEGVGQTALVINDLKNVVYSGFLIRFRDSYGLDLEFKKYCFMNNEFRLRLLAKSTTSANTNINQESLSALFIKIPCLEEQSKIANFLSAIDQKIEVVAQQIEQAKTWKKGLLQQMFV